MLSKRFIKWAIPLTLILALLVGLFQAGRASESERFAQERTFLAQIGDCTAPCWYGIQPGVTAAQDAIDQLKTHPWIDADSVNAFLSAPGASVTWRWNAAAPIFVHNAALRLPPHLWVTNNTVQYVLIPTLIPFADIWLIYGRPQHGGMTVLDSAAASSLQGDNTLNSASYFDGRMIFTTNYKCPVRPLDFWNAPVTMTLYSPRDAPSFREQSYVTLSRLFRPPCRG